ncbi:MAG: YdcF family protein [Candidatus Scalindua sp.]|nr:YdcF family protein [Candidatus Scalindua sp.]
MILYLFSIRPTADFLLKPLEQKYIENNNPFSPADAIVVLAGGEGKRLIKGVSLFHKKLSPLIIMSGGSGSIFDQSRKDALLMKESAVELGVPEESIIAEAESRNTRENAINTRQILDKIGAKRVLLVTTASHMPRSYALFKKIGIDAVPVATDFFVKPAPYNPFSFVPNAGDLLNSTMAIHEYIGIIAYRMKGWI